jgi:hypothetical protein
MGYSSFAVTGDLKSDVTHVLERGGIRRVVDIEVDRFDEEDDDLVAVAYAAVENVSDGTVAATVSIVRSFEGDLAIKNIPEHAGPIASECPVRILDQLSPTSDAGAVAWRHKALVHGRDAVQSRTI